MNSEGKIFAPKPIRRTVDLPALKYSKSIGCPSIKKNNKLILNLKYSEFTDEISKKPFNSSFPNNECDSTKNRENEMEKNNFISYEEFESQINYDISKQSATSEILSILSNSKKSFFDNDINKKNVNENYDYYNDSYGNLKVYDFKCKNNNENLNVDHEKNEISEKHVNEKASLNKKYKLNLKSNSSINNNLKNDENFNFQNNLFANDLNDKDKIDYRDELYDKNSNIKLDFIPESKIYIKALSFIEDKYNNDLSFNTCKINNYTSNLQNKSKKNSYKNINESENKHSQVPTENKNKCDKNECLNEHFYEDENYNSKNNNETFKHQSSVKPQNRNAEKLGTALLVADTNKCFLNNMNTVNNKYNSNNLYLLDENFYSQLENEKWENYQNLALSSFFVSSCNKKICLNFNNYKNPNFLQRKIFKTSIPIRCKNPFEKSISFESLSKIQQLFNQQLFEKSSNNLNIEDLKNFKSNPEFINNSSLFLDKNNLEGNDLNICKI